MPREGRRTLRVVLSVLLLLSGVLIALAINDGTHDSGAIEPSATLLSEPELHLQYGRHQLSLTMTTSSAEQESTLQQLISDQFADVEVQTEFRPGLQLPARWDAISTQLLYLVAATNSATASINSDGIAIRGVSVTGNDYRQRLAFLEEALADDLPLAADVVFSDPEISVATMCRRNFTSISRQTIRFRQSSTAIRQSSYQLLDRLSEFAYDCRATRLAIIGHTDATGEESWNILVSRARAQAVADHLIANGLAAERLIVEGVGSQRPLAENDTVQGRERNRRIEFELRPL